MNLELTNSWPDEDKRTAGEVEENSLLSQKIKIHKIFQKEGSVSSVRKVKQDEDWLCAMEVITGLTKAFWGTNILEVESPVELSRLSETSWV